jgi:hypothetical protein
LNDAAMPVPLFLSFWLLLCMLSFYIFTIQ